MFTEGGNLNSVVEESYTNFATTKAYNLEEYARKKHSEVNKRRCDAEFRASYISSVVRPIITFTNALSYIAICLVGVWLIVSTESITVGAVVTVLLFAKQFSGPLEQIAGGFGDLQHAKAAAKRVFKLMDLAEEEAPQAKPEHKIRGEVIFEHVDFSYDKEKPLIQDLNIRVKPGQNVAIVGPTGAGKTTIVNLLMRFYDIDSGKILLDGMDMAKTCGNRNAEAARLAPTSIRRIMQEIEG